MDAACLTPRPPWDTDISPMKTTLSFSAPAAIETEALVVVVLDRGDKDKPQVDVDSSDAAIKEAAAEVFASGEAAGKPLEITLLHHPAKLKAKKLLLLGGGRPRSFPHSNCASGRRRGASAQITRRKEFRFCCPGKA